MSRGSVVRQLEDVGKFLGSVKVFLAKTPGGETLAREAEALARKIPDIARDVKRHWEKDE